MLDNEYSVDILINDKPVRKFPFDGKFFVEARPQKEYSIRIKNNTWKRILAITSVDGLDVLTGKSAKENGNGYVINGHSSLNLDGFRVSDETVAKFIFDRKGSSYAASKEDGSEKNVGVIGVRIFEEKVIPPQIIREEHHHHYNNWKYPWTDLPIVPKNPFQPTITWCDNTMTSNSGVFADNFTYSGNDGLKGNVNNTMENYSNNITTKGMAHGPIKCSTDVNNTLAFNNVLRSVNPKGFDMGTKWGEAKESKVIEVEFEKGILAITSNIYYASRESLIEMGVPITNEKQVSFPEPFSDSKYAKPPKHWKG